MKTKRASILASALAVAAFGAGTAHAAAPSITSSSVVEGTSLSVQIAHTCKVKKKCTYTVTTRDGTATAGADYTPATATGKAKKGKTFTATMPVDTANDAACEPDETLIVHVDVTNKKGTFGFDAPQTITDDDCQTPDPQPAQPAPPAPDPNAPSVPIPTNPAGATVTSHSGARVSGQLCETQFTTGIKNSNDRGYIADECYVWAKCPASTSGCTARAEHHIKGTNDFLVHGDETADFFDAGGNLVNRIYHDCTNGYGSCGTNATQIPVGPGQTVLLNCGGTYDPGNKPIGAPVYLDTRARVTCDLTVAW